MKAHRNTVKLTIETAKQIINLLGESWDEDAQRATPVEICDNIGISRRTFNSIISQTIFTKHPTEAQMLLRTHIMHILHGEWYS